MAKIRLVAVLLVFVAAGVYYFFGGGSNNASEAQVGDCMKNTGTSISPDFEIVGCTDSSAAFKVEQRNPADSQCEAPYSQYRETHKTSRRHRETTTLCLSELVK
ncbi:hypothetical protein [Streptomyces sp. NPDC093109]|uniref:LppU/SCO3897 family protein n=1 Tax=Streptomyces sp. NPDC093109 TaxID=3154977 RepID=UPI003450C962